MHRYKLPINYGGLPYATCSPIQSSVIRIVLVRLPHNLTATCLNIRFKVDSVQSLGIAFGFIHFPI